MKRIEKVRYAMQRRAVLIALQVLRKVLDRINKDFQSQAAIIIDEDFFEFVGNESEYCFNSKDPIEFIESMQKAFNFEFKGNPLK